MNNKMTIIEEHEKVLAQFKKEKINGITKIAEIISRQLREGKKMYIFGNGGSAADADHLCAELVIRFEKERKGFNVRNLASSCAVITAAGNDYGFGEIYRKQLHALSDEGDIAMGITTSGRSENVINGLRYAKNKGLKTILLTGEGGKYLNNEIEYVLAIPSTRTAVIQQFHIMSIHLICEMIDSSS